LYEEDIRFGERNACWYCPVARAIRRTLAAWVAHPVGPYAVVVSPRIISITLPGFDVHYYVPAMLRGRLESYDVGDDIALMAGMSFMVPLRAYQDNGWIIAGLSAEAMQR